MTALIIVKSINYFGGPNTYLHVCGRREVLLVLVTPKLYHVFRVGLILVLGDQIDYASNLRKNNYWKRNGKGAKCPVPTARLLYQQAIQMISVHWLPLRVNYFFCVCVLHDCLNPIGGALKSQRQVLVYAHERTFLRLVAHCGSVMDSLLEVKLIAMAMNNNEALISLKLLY